MSPGAPNTIVWFSPTASGASVRSFNPAVSVTVCGSESVTVVPAARAASTSLTLATPMVIMPGAAAAMASFVRVTPE